MSITTGAATGGNGGDIKLEVGDGNTGDGGAMTLTAGKTTGNNAVGGAVTIAAGQASSQRWYRRCYVVGCGRGR